MVFDSVVILGGKKKHSPLLSSLDALPPVYRPCFRYIRCYDEILHTHSHTGVTRMWVLDSSQYLLTLQQPLFRPGAQQEMNRVHGELRLSNKDLWCGDVTSWQPCNSVWCGVSVGGRGGEEIPHCDGRRVGRDRRGKGAVNEHRSRRMLWSVRVRLLGLPSSFPTQASVVLRCNRSAAPDLNYRSQRKKKKQIYRRSAGGGTEFIDNKDVSEESVISLKKLPELQTHLQSRTITPLS